MRRAPFSVGVASSVRVSPDQPSVDENSPIPFRGSSFFSNLLEEVGAFSWHELLSADPDAAFGFYSSLFGWVKTDAMDMGDIGTYQMYGYTADGSVGGILKKPAEMPMSAWVLYVNVASTDDAVGQVKEMGGQLMNGPMDIPGGGRIAQCMDPQGAVFALHSMAK